MKRKLEVGYKHVDFEVRCYQYILEQKNVNLTMLFLSDLHLNRYSGEITDRIIGLFKKDKPDLILFGGDYLDEKKGLKFLKSIFIIANKVSKTFAILGNHDMLWNSDIVKKSIKETGTTILNKNSSTINLSNISIQIDGQYIDDHHPDDIDLKVACFHKPQTITKFISKYNIVLAGHLHGCQVILWGDEAGYYPGKLFYPNNIGKYRDAELLYLVSKGLGDTLPVRYNCPRDILKISVQSKYS